jgi:MoxR-like ATPase
MRIDGHILGRDDEVAQITEWLQEGRPFYVSGPPGVGKTALIEACIRNMSTGEISRVIVEPKAPVASLCEQLGGGGRAF